MTVIGEGTIRRHQHVDKGALDREGGLLPFSWERLFPEDAERSGPVIAFFELIRHSSHLYLYGGCNWAFFNNNGGCNGDKCQENAIQIESSSEVYLYGTNTKSTANMVMEGQKAMAKEDATAGGWGRVIAAYLYDV